MRIEIKQTNGMPSIIDDLHKYTDRPIGEYLSDLVFASLTDNPAEVSGLAFIPIDLTVQIGKRGEGLILDGKVQEAVAKRVLLEIEGFSANAQIVPNDTLEIVANSLEHDLFVRINPNAE